MSDPSTPASRLALSIPMPISRRKPAPSGPARALPVIGLLLDYGRHLFAAIDQRTPPSTSSRPGEAIGSSTSTVMLARVYRGMLRALALQHVLLARAAPCRGRAVTKRATLGAPEPQTDAPAPAAVSFEPARLAPRVVSRRIGAALVDPEHVPTLAELEAEVSRLPVGRVIAEICCDLGVAPGPGAGRFWSGLFVMLTRHRGNLAGFMRDLRRRQVLFTKELDHNPSLDRPACSRDAMRLGLGLFVEVPDAPRLPAATGIDADDVLHAPPTTSWMVGDRPSPAQDAPAMT